MENITSTATRLETPFELFVKKMSNLYDHLAVSGRIGYVTNRRDFKVNWKDQAKRGIMAGYAESKPGDTYRIYIYDTNHVIKSRDISWCDWEPKTARDKMPGVFDLREP